MATIQLPRDFNEFLRLLNAESVDYLLIGGYAVNYHGYSRSTGDMDVWISPTPDNIVRTVSALRQFGFTAANSSLFNEPNGMLRMGVPPLRLEILTSIDGVTFADCFSRRVTADLEGILVPVINFDDLKRNKRAGGRAKDLADLEELEG